MLHLTIAPTWSVCRFLCIHTDPQVKREPRTPSPTAKAGEAKEQANESIPPKSKQLKTPDSSPFKPSSTFSDADRGRFLDDIIAAGAKSADLDALAVKVSRELEAGGGVAGWRAG